MPSVNLNYPQLFLPLAILTLLLLPAPAAAGQVNSTQCCIKEEAKRGEEFKAYDCYVKPDSQTECNIVVTRGQCRSSRVGISCDPDRKERQDDCVKNSALCRAALIETLINCPNLSAADCENERNRASCFLYQNRCYSRVDGNVCPRIRDADNCAKSSRCRWRDNRCLSLLEAGLSGQYATSSDSLLSDPCITRGTCRDVNDLLRLALNYSKRLFGLLGVIGFVMFVYGGITMVLSFGSPEKFKKGQMALVAAIIGIVIALSAYLLVNFILNAIGATAEFRAIQ